jgi:hypothetical protein
MYEEKVLSKLLGSHFLGKCFFSIFKIYKVILTCGDLILTSMDFDGDSGFIGINYFAHVSVFLIIK